MRYSDDWDLFDRMVQASDRERKANPIDEQYNKLWEDTINSICAPRKVKLYDIFGNEIVENAMNKVGE